MREHLYIMLGLIAFELPCAASPQAGDRKDDPQKPLPDELVVPPAPALTPEEELATFRVPPGFRVELAAAEPLVRDPVAIAFDSDGRLWVVEMRTYMPNVDGEGELEATNGIVVLEDTDGDGRMDTRTEFLGGLVLPRAVLPMNDPDGYRAALVIVPPEILYCRDTTGDGRADERIVVDVGAGGLQSPEHAVNGLMPTLDNWIACANHGWRYRRVGEEWERQRTAGGGQWGITKDDAGRVFFNTNSDAFRGDLIPSHYAVRNPNQGRAKGTNVRIARDQSVYPSRITPGINRGYQPHMLDDYKLTVFTGACGPLVYRGDAFPAEFKGNAFIAEPCGNLIKRYRVDELNDGGLSAEPAYTDDEFMTSTDERFRPVNLADGPDGALWVVDMYRGLIQHRVFVTSFLRKQVLDRGLEQPIGRGRIWRIVADDAPEEAVATVALADATWTELAALLEHPNGWWRDQAQRIFVAEGRGDQDALELARAAATGAEAALGRMHALWALEGLGGLDAELLQRAMKDRDPRVRLAAVRCAERALARGDEQITRRVLDLGGSDPDTRVRWQVLLSLGEAQTELGDAALAELLLKDSKTAERRTAAFSGLFGRELEFLERLLGDARWGGVTEGRKECFKLAARCITTELRGDRVESLLARIATPEGLEPWQREALMDGVLSGRPKGPDGRPDLLRLAEEPNWHESLGALQLDKSRNAKRNRLLDSIAWPGREGYESVEITPLTAAESVLFERGRVAYAAVCSQCHQPSGKGEAGKAPSLRFSPYVLDSKQRLIRIVSDGLVGPLEMDDQRWDMEMPAYVADDETLAAVLTYIRREWGHGASAVSRAEVAREREATRDRKMPWTIEELGD